MTERGWKSYNGGRRWRKLSTGHYEVEGQGVIRTSGAPLTMMYLVREWGEAITFAAEVAGIPREYLAAMITVEAARNRNSPLDETWSTAKRLGRLVGSAWRRVFGDEATWRKHNRLRFDPISLRFEPGYVNIYDTPGRVSASLGQVLYSTARAMAAKHDLKLKLDIGGRTLDLSDSTALIFEPHLCLVVAALYMRDRMDVHGDDLVLLTGSYNAGSLKPSTSNPFGMLTYHATRTDSCIRYYNDALDPRVKELWP